MQEADEELEQRQARGLDEDHQPLDGEDEEVASEDDDGVAEPVVDPVGEANDGGGEGGLGEGEGADADEGEGVEGELEGAAE